MSGYHSVCFFVTIAILMKDGKGLRMRQSNQALIIASFRNDIPAAIEAIDKNMAQINTTISIDQNPNCSTPVIIACTSPLGTALVSELLKRGADITQRSSGFWYPANEGSTTSNKIHQGNALDVALFFSSVETVQKLLLHAVLHLDSVEQSNLLERMPEKNVLLYVAKTFPQYLNELFTKILTHNDMALTQRVMQEFISVASDMPRLQAQYRKWLENFPSVLNALNTMKFDEFFSAFQAMPINKDATKLLKALTDAKVAFVQSGDKDAFIATILEVIQIALPALGTQPAWKVIFGYFLEALSFILPISRKQIEFYKNESDAARHLKQMHKQVSALLEKSEPPIPEISVAVLTTRI